MDSVSIYNLTNLPLILSYIQTDDVYEYMSEYTYDIYGYIYGIWRNITNFF